LNLGKIKMAFRYLGGIPKSIYVNFRLLPFKQAIKMPIIVSRKTTLSSLSGSVSLDKLKTGSIRIGFGNVELIDYQYQRTVLHISGHIHFDGKCKIGLGSRIMVHGYLKIGEGFLLSGNGTIICTQEIEIGSNTSFAWESLLMDTDEHPIYDKEKNIINPDKAIFVGNDVWIAARSMLLKGSYIPNGCIVGANSLITKKFTTQKAIIAGNPEKIIKEDVTWRR
jgi:acetyltransferase-like isoleucine patch superfamily enzyme